MLTVLYFNGAGEVHVARIRPENRWFQADDGYHIIPKDAIYTDAEGKHEPIAILFQDVLVAHGAKDPEAIESAAAMEVSNCGVESKKVLVSRRWARAWAKLSTWAWRTLYFFGAVFGVVFGLLVLFIILGVVL